MDKLETIADDILKLVDEYEEIKLSVASAKIGIDKISLENWARTLEQYGAVKIVYPIIGEPILKKTNKTYEIIKKKDSSERKKTKLDDLLDSMKKTRDETIEKQAVEAKAKIESKIETKIESKIETKKTEDEIIEETVPVIKPETKIEVKPKVEEKKAAEVEKEEDSGLHADELIAEYEEIKKRAEKIKNQVLEGIKKERSSLTSELSDKDRVISELDLNLKNTLDEMSKLEIQKRKADEEISEIIKRKSEIESKLRALNPEDMKNKISSVKSVKKAIEEKIEKLIEKEKRISM